MGALNLIKRAYDAGKWQVKLARSITEIIEQIDFFCLTKEIKYLQKAAYVARIGIIENPLYPTLHYNKCHVFIVVHQQSIRMPIFEALSQSLFRIYEISIELLEDDKHLIDSILEKGNSFYQIDRNTPQTYKDKFYSE